MDLGSSEGGDIGALGTDSEASWSNELFLEGPPFSSRKYLVWVFCARCPSGKRKYERLKRPGNCRTSDLDLMEDERAFQALSSRSQQ